MAGARRLVRRRGDVVEVCRAGNLVGASRGWWAGWGHMVGLASVLDVRKQQPDPSRVPGAYIRHAPNNRG